MRLHLRIIMGILRRIIYTTVVHVTFLSHADSHVTCVSNVCQKASHNFSDEKFSLPENFQRVSFFQNLRGLIRFVWADFEQGLGFEDFEFEFGFLNGIRRNP